MFNFFKRLDKLFLLIVLGNIWIWKIFSLNLLVALLVIGGSWFLYKSVEGEKVSKILILFLVILAIFQIKTTKNIVPLGSLTPQEKLFQVQRLKEYPPTYIKIFNKNLWLYPEQWFENKSGILSLYRIQKNLTDTLSPNLYFFSNHPNERVGFKEFEMFSYFLFPFFVIGFLNFDYKKNWQIFVFSFIVPLFVFALIGQVNPFGPLLLFPFILLSVIAGIRYIYEKVRKSKLIDERVAIGIFLFVYIMIFTQIGLYAQH